MEGSIQNPIDTTELRLWEDNVRFLLMEFILNQRSRSTARSYLQEIHWFFQFLSPDKGISLSSLKQVEQAHLVLFRQHLEQNDYVAATIVRKLAAVSSFYVFLVEKGVVKENPVQGVKRPLVAKVVKTPDFSNVEVRRILGGISTKKVSGKLHLAVLTSLFYLGLRCHELVGLLIGSFLKIDGKFAIKFIRKGGGETVVPLPQEVVEPIADYLRERANLNQASLNTENYLFLSYENIKAGRNKPMNESSIRYILTRYAQKAQITHKFTIHSTRATFIGSALDKGVPLEKVARWVDHKDINLTRAYSKRRELTKVAEELEGLYE